MPLHSFAAKSFLVVLFLVTLSTSAFAATQIGTLSGAANEYQYYDITLPSPQSGARLVLSSDLATDFYLYTGTNHAAGSSVASSTSKTLHTLLVAPASLSDGASYHVRIRAAGGAATAGFSFRFTDDLTYYRDLTWDPGTSLAGTAIMNQPDTAGGDYLIRITAQASLNGAWRSALGSPAERRTCISSRQPRRSAAVPIHPPVRLRRVRPGRRPVRLQPDLVLPGPCPARRHLAALQRRHLRA